MDNGIDIVLVDEEVETEIEVQGNFLKGDKGDTGATGNGIERIEKTNSVGLIDTYTIYFTDGKNTTFDIINGEKGNTGNGIESTTLNEDYTLTIKFTDGTSYKTNSIRGKQGLQGEQGPKGEKGDTGSVGEQGPKGDKGDTGPQGPQGLQGLQGERGLTGPQGEQGEKGETGSEGPQGKQGEQGLSAYQVAIKNGYKGTETEWIASLKGEKGDKGEQGEQGEQGTQGVQGNKGDKGDKGDTGSIGPTGAKGDKGDTGATGNGIKSITLKEGSHLAGQYDKYLITFTNGTTQEFEVYNGKNGEGSGDMSTEVYDTNNNGIVDNAEKVNNHTVESNVPANAKFTDTNTTYTLTQDSNDGHKITLTPSSGTATTITIPDNNTTYNVATTSANGLMSSTDKSKLDGIATGATKNTVENSLTSTSTSNALSAAQGKALNTSITNLKPVSLYNNSSGTTGTVTLSESAANFSYIDLFFYNNLSTTYSYGHARIYNPNGKKAVFSNVNYVDDVLQVSFANWTFSGTTLSVGGERYFNVKTSGTAVAWEVAVTRHNYLVKVVGYK